MNSYEEQRAAQLARLDAYMRDHPPTPDTNDAPEVEPDDPTETWVKVGGWPPAPMGAPR